MILLGVENIRKNYGPEPVLDGVTFDVRPGERIGLVGPNGSGKTTLLRILAGHEDPDGGRFQLHGSVRLRYLEQQPRFPAGRTLWDEARSALDDLVKLGRQAIEVADKLAHSPEPAEHKRLAARFDHLQQELHRRDAYNLDHKIERVLDGLHFPRDSFQLPVRSLSGGEQNRLILAKLLLAEPDLIDTLPGGIRILSPFDPALRDRKRAERLFGFHYRIEIFVPAHRRRYGYYVFPVLERDGLVGRIDMKRRSAEAALQVEAFWPEPGVRMGKGRLARLEAELHRVARFSGCDRVSFADGWMRETRA